MFKRSRRRIVAAIMSVLVLLWVGTLGVIYGSSYYTVSNRNREMLAEHVAMHTLRLPGKEEIRPIHPQGGHFYEDSPAFKLATFYSVAVAYDGTVLEVQNRDNGLYTDEKLLEMTRSLMKAGKQEGITEDLIYRLADKGGYILAGYMDNTVMRQSMNTLFQYTLIFGALALVAFYFLAVYLAKRIVSPLEESYGKQKQFISDAGHELKTPVTVIGANAELLERQIGENPWLSNILWENQRMGVLVGQLLELTRTENVELPKTVLDLSRLVGGQALPFESLAFEKGMGLECHIAPGLRVEGNPGKLEQLVAILLDNALCHGTEGTDILLRLTGEKNTARLSVINGGAPIPKEQMDRLFERFFRTDTARTGEDGHYGLGLAIAKAIVTAHNGKIRAACYDGKIEFSVELPLK